MAKRKKIQRISANFSVREFSPLDLSLDPENPRLNPSERGSAPPELLRIMLRRFKVEELGTSIVASGYTDLDPILAYQAKGETFVREGNRRIAALKLLLKPELAPEKYRQNWRRLSKALSPETKSQISKVRVFVYADANDIAVESYIGFRHVSGVLEWPAEEKARFIVEMVDRHHWTYEEIARRIGSYAKHVERHYIASRIMQQAQIKKIEGWDRITFGVLLRALQARGISEFLGVKFPGNAKKSRAPVPEARTTNFEFFVSATFGTESQAPILPESRDLTKWGRILSSRPAIAYLRNATHPKFERAWLKSGGKQQSVSEMLEAAADNLEDAIPLLPDLKNDAKVQEALERCVRRLLQASRDFPKIKRLMHSNA